MLRKMYTDNINGVKSLHSYEERADSLGKKKLDFRFYWSALLRNKWLIILFTALMTALAIIYSEDLVSSEQESSDYYGTQYAILKSRALAARALDHLAKSDDVSQEQLDKLLTLSSPANADGSTDGSKMGDTSLADHFDKAKYNRIINRFRESLKISPVANTKLVKISYESADPKFAAIAANAVADQYIENELDQRKLRKGDASAWMDSRVQELKAKLEESEDTLFSYKKAYGLIDFNGDVGRLHDQQLEFLSSELAEAKNELSVATDVYLKTQNYKTNSPKLLDTLPYVQSNAAVRSANAELVLGHIAAFENDYQLLQKRVATLEAKVAENKLISQDIEQQEISLYALEREAEANRDQYNKMFDRITEIRTTDGLDEASAVVSEAAWVATNPIKPNKVLIVAAAMLASLLLATAVSFIKEYLDNAVNNKADIQDRLKTKLIGVIPLVERESSKNKGDNSITTSGAASASKPFLEAINSCRTALSISGGKGPQTILVTSAVPNEGKSTIALDLAYSFGQLERTLLIDCDLRRPSIASALGMPADRVGLTNLLLDKAIQEGSIQFGVWGSFDCLTSGPVPANPQELLASEKFANGLNTLRKLYDRIIIDCAPTHVVNDAIVLGQLVDEVLFVVKPHDTPIKLVNNGLSRLTEAQATIAGICISRVDINKSKSYGDMEFDGFRTNFKKYEKYYTESDFGENPPPLKLTTG